MMPEVETEPADSDASAEGGQTAASCEHRRIGWFFRVVLAGYILLLTVFAILFRDQAIVPLGDAVSPLAWSARILAAGLLVGGRFLLLGFLVACSAAPSMRVPRVHPTLGRWLAMALLLLPGIGLFVLLSIARSGHLPNMLFSALPLTGYLIGMWIGFTCRRGWRAALWLVPKVGLLVLVVGAGVAATAFLAMDDAPLPFPSPEVTSAEKRRLVEVLHGSSPAGDRLKKLSLSERDVNLLLAMAMQHAFSEGKANVQIDSEAIRGEMSTRITDSPILPPYLNVRVTCRGGLAAGQLEINVERCRVGRLAVPRFVLDLVSPALTSTILDDPELNNIIASIESVLLDSDRIEAVFKSGELRYKLKTSLLARLGEDSDVVSRARAYFRHLAFSAERLPRDDRFEAFVQSAFQLAQKRSKDDDPVEENRAAILALAMLLGHRHVETLVGQVADEELRLSAERHVGSVALRRRTDWSKHFLVSAALALLSNESLSDAAGLLKEELDAGEGGSGFSFSDLLADRAGTLFALAATRDKKSARRMQDRLAAGFDIDEVFPPAADLPEGIQDAELQAKYGGVGGEEYMGVIREIERRLAGCEALR